jgi:hypothetical protein
MASQTHSDCHGPASVRLTFDLYGHIFESVEADREDMKKLEAAVRAA